LSLEGSSTGAIKAAGVIVGDKVVCSNGFQASGGVDFYGANLSGDLVCEGGIFENDNGRALDVGAARVGGDVLLSRGFRAIGEVGLYKATINGDLICDGGNFVNEGKIALNAGAVTVGGAVFLRKGNWSEGFRAVGEVGLYRANVSGDLICEDGTFKLRPSGRYARARHTTPAKSVPPPLTPIIRWTKFTDFTLL
jgi:hypothetical protein